MVKVIKLDERQEDFSEDKLKNSIKHAMDSVEIKDDTLVDSILEEVNIFIKDKDYVLTKDLRNEIIKILATKHDSKVAKAYMMFVKEDRESTINNRFSKIYTPDPSECGT